MHVEKGLRKDQLGFTLIELIVTMTIAVILITLAAPAFNDLLRSNRMTAQANELLSMLTIARSEAVKRGASVYTCVIKDADDVGWTATVSLASDCSGTSIRKMDYSGVDVVLDASHTVNYGSMGRPDGAYNYELVHKNCETGKTHRREVNVTAVGRATVNKADASKVCS